MIVKRLVICCLVVCALVVATESSAGGGADWQSAHFDSLEGIADEWLLRKTLLMRCTAEYYDSLEAGNKWWCITELLDNYTDVLTKGSIGGIGSSDIASGGDPSGSRMSDEELTALNREAWTHSGRTWHFWRSLAHYGRGAHELGLWNDLDPEVRRVLEELEAAISPLLVPRDTVTGEPIGREKLRDPKGRSEQR